MAGPAKRDAGITGRSPGQYANASAVDLRERRCSEASASGATNPHLKLLNDATVRDRKLKASIDTVRRAARGMEAGGAAEEFITIVPVGEGKPAVKNSAFVTVLSVDAEAGAAEIIVQRPRGARLGLGLKFEGGSAAAEKVRRLLVQSCAEESPAANASAPWGKLIPGDEILAIDGVSVSELTRIDCVRRLKDSDETLKLLVRHFDPSKKSEDNKMDSVEELLHSNQTSDLSLQINLPPPVPPRKLGKKNSFKDKQTLQTVGEQNALFDIDAKKQCSNDKETSQHGISTVTKLSRKSSFDSHIHRQNKEGIAYLKKGSPDEVRRLVRRLSDGKVMPPEADVYIDLLSNEWERCLVMADAESDDTGSSISTVVDRLGSMTSSVENSIPSTPIMQPKSFDIQKVLNCIENIDSNILKDMTNGKYLEKGIDFKKEFKKIENHSNGFASHETQNTQIKEDTLLMSKKQKQINDRNNNYTTAQNNPRKSESNENKNEEIDIKNDVATEKPKPMPRNTKIERSASDKKRKPISIPETITSSSVPEPLLTPTKKTCIETWLQRSEAEMKNKMDDKFDENITPEVLPRLIDFVPKSQFKENTNETPVCTRPTTAPPPPPVETREDGSGASLDTIGELDESSDVTDSTKSVKKNETKTRKSSFERNFWEDRIHKSDAEDKSLSNDETPLPTCPRQPPDGVETPSDTVDKAPDLPTRLPPRLPSSWSTTRPRLSYLSRTQDARSEASVKDKIAMFSNDVGASSDRLDKCGTLPTRTKSTSRKNSSSNYTNSFAEASTLDRRLTKSQDNLDDTPRSFKRHIDRPEVLGALETNNKEIKGNRLSHTELTKMPLFYGSTTTLPSNVDTSFSRSIYHTRSVSDDISNKNVSTHKLEHIIEQRKKSMSKLRGLVIPEVHTPIVDLPEIKVKDSFSKPFVVKSNPNNTLKKDNFNTSKSIKVNENKWKTNFLPNNIPKYSPAFKRKSLQVYSPSSLSKESTPERKLIDRVDVQNQMYNKSNQVKSSRSTINSTNAMQLSGKEYKNVLNDFRDYKNVEVKICTTTDIVDSDNESAVSSAQSSYRSSASSPMHHNDTIESDSSRLSPRISHYTSYKLVKSEIPSKSSNTEKRCEEFIKRKVCRSVSSDTNISLSSSAGSAATSGSQASCSSLESSVADSDKRKVSKTYNVDTINRRNILASAKCRSGRDMNLKSPVVESKFSHESYDRSLSPVQKSSERLSTLAPSVSALTNKGENRRRNKIIAESDSDTDDETQTRHRKSEYKTSRLKRNSSTSSKNKVNENNNETPKIEDGPKCTNEKSLIETNKIGFDNVNEIKSKPTLVQSTQKIGELLKRNETDMIKLKKTVNDNFDVVDNSRALGCENSVRILSSNNNEAINKKLDNSSIEERKFSTSIIRLKKGAGSGVGLILAGGIDCEAKDVTVHRVLADSIAAKAGLKRGSKVRSINGISMMGLTHAQSVTILKEQRSEVIIEIDNDAILNDCVTVHGSENAESKDRQVIDDSKSKENKTASDIVTVMLEKAGGGTGLGFGLDGGRDSPHGDRPLTIKKLFAGGAAAQSGRILVGAELLSAGGQSMETFTRTQAWAALKSLPVGPVAIVLRNPKGNTRA